MATAGGIMVRGHAAVGVSVNRTGEPTRWRQPLGIVTAYSRGRLATCGNTTPARRVTSCDGGFRTRLGRPGVPRYLLPKLDDNPATTLARTTVTDDLTSLVEVI